MMFANAQRIGLKALTCRAQATTIARRALFPSTTPAAVVSSVSDYTFNRCGTPPISHNFSTLAMDAIPLKKTELGTVTRTLETLDMSVVEKIKAELMEADVKNDGRIDAEELKTLLRSHNNTFTDSEIIEISDLYYAVRAGGSVSIDRFIEAIDHAVVNADKGGRHFTKREGHPLGAGSCAAEYMGAAKSHGNYTSEELDVKLTHVKPEGIKDTIALNSVKAVRFFFDTATGWTNNSITTDKVLQRVIFLETVAAVPGMVAAIIRHFRSLRKMQRDGGLLQMFLEEANNERMHLLTFVGMKNPSYAFRVAVLGGQIGFGSGFFLAYMISPKFCHRFVGYIEEEACSTYTKIIDAIENAPDGSDLAEWRTEPAPKIALAYWKLGEKGTVLDLMYAVRADEAEHRDVNHLVSEMKDGQVNPMFDPQVKLDMMLRKYVRDIMKAN